MTNLDSTPLRAHIDVLAELLPITGRLLDIGCGDGWLTRALAERGATVTGIEVSPEAVARAEAVPAVGDERYILGKGEDMPIEDGTVDGVIFFNSLHHVPTEAQEAALAEARRVLAAEGWCAVAEPLAEGRFFEMMRPVDDETEVRAHAAAVIQRAAARGFAMERETFYRAAMEFADFDALRARMTAINPGRHAIFDRLDTSLRENFARLSEPAEGGYRFIQPMRVNVLRAVSSSDTP